MSGDSVTMYKLIQEKACLTEKNAMAIPRNPLYGLFVLMPVGITAMAWDLGTLRCLGNFSLFERIITNEKRTYENFPINVAVTNGHDEVVRMMLQAGVKPHNEAIWKAARQDEAAVILELLNNGNIGANWQYDGWPLLMWTARDSAPSVTHLLISRGAFVNYKDQKGWTPLYLAARNNHVHGANYLIAAGANIHDALNAAYRDGDADKSITVVKTLVNAGAPASAFASHYLYGDSDSTLAIAITKAGAAAAAPVAPPPAPVVAAPKQQTKTRPIQAKKKAAPVRPQIKRKSVSPKPTRKPAPKPTRKPAPKPVLKPAPKPTPVEPKRPSNSSILKDFI